MESTQRDAGWATIPNLVTVMRFLLIVPVVVVLLQGGEGDWLPVVLLGVWASTDWIDGQLARRLDQVSVIGAKLDPFVDRLGTAVIAVTLAVIGALPWWMLAVLIAFDLLATILGVKAAAEGRLPVTWIGKIRTAVLFFGLVFLVAAVTVLPWLTIPAYVLLVVGLVLHVISTVGYSISAVRQGIARRAAAR
ncbi:CDP-alcohol phosphatidyltransferase family protein [Agrococcus jejuensis]|uniref:CDP-diacylglycerol--glycerol-3-phosphate 3-phosphatidyltransferase n=1 Tax=Agrococcus jejuensis TaxID=399736 RepID=A0A1G8G3L1_9MICO|nr:CDP-alcohol phosphatidyltransferase family protein [Agrococcus jejuensis]SDH88955.1 CDP-diacylglycerol--glycerol-3-phosphate 3-phosphatidyltransferase [Agrococcus jejuensis]